MSIGTTGDDINRNNISHKLQRPNVPEYQNSLPVLPNQMTQSGGDRLLAGDEMFSFVGSSNSQRNIVRSDARYSGDQDRLGGVTGKRRRQSRSANRFKTQGSRRQIMDEGRKYLDGSTNDGFASKSGLFPNDRNYEEWVDVASSGNGYEMKTRRMSRTYVNKSYDNDSFA